MEESKFDEWLSGLNIEPHKFQHRTLMTKPHFEHKYQLTRIHLYMCMFVHFYVCLDLDNSLVLIHLCALHVVYIGCVTFPSPQFHLMHTSSLFIHSSHYRDN